MFCRGTLLLLFVMVAVMVEIAVSNRCRGGFDLYFVLDKSSSVKYQNFKVQTVSFVEKIVSSFVSSQLRVSFITFSTNAQLIMGLTDNRTAIKVGLDALRKVRTGGETYMGLGIKKANDQIKTLGERTAGAIIALTDGHIGNHKRETFEEARKARLYGASVYAVGVDNYDKDELKNIADKPSGDHVFVAENYDDLQNIIDSIIKKSCIEVISAEPTNVCAEERVAVTLHGNGFTKTDNTSGVHCNFKLGNVNQISKSFYVDTNVMKCFSPKLPLGSKANIQVSVNSVKYVSSDVVIEAIDCRPRITDVTHTDLCAGKPTLITVSGEHLTRESNASQPNVACRVTHNKTFAEPSEVVSLTSSTMKCQTAANNEIGRTVYFQVTSPNYGNVFKSVSFKVVSCAPIKKQVNVGLIVGIIFALFLLVLVLVWWFWLVLFPKPKQEPVSPTSSTGPPKKKWPSVDTSYYGGGGIGGISPVEVKWGGKGATDAGALLAAAKDAKKNKNTPSSSSEDEPTPSCWNTSKERVVAFFMVFPKAYTWLASKRPQRGKGKPGEEYMQVRQV